MLALLPYQELSVRKLMNLLCSVSSVQIKLGHELINRTFGATLVHCITQLQTEKPLSWMMIAFIVCEYAAGHKLLLSYQNTF